MTGLSNSGLIEDVYKSQDNTSTISPNTINNRSLKAILDHHIAWSNVDKSAWFNDYNIVVVYDGCDNAALNTIAWFMYGKKLTQS